VFDRAFDALSLGYGRLVRSLAGAWVAVLISYVLLMAFAGWFVQRLPTGFIPALDRAILIISLQLPPGAALARTDAVVQRATDLVLSTPGVKYSNAFTGRNGATFTAATNAGLLFLVLDDFEERHQKGQTIDASKVPGLRAAILRVLVGGVPNSGGFGGGVSTPKKPPPQDPDE